MMLSILQNLIVLFVLAGLASADQRNQHPLHTQPEQSSTPHRIAIIGAGAAGSSTAYYLSQFANETDIPVDITIFESQPRVGGRTTTVNALNDPRYPTELGASIFVEVNHILYNATRDFGLSTKERQMSGTGSKYNVGIWNGLEFVFTVTNDDESSSFRWFKGYWDIVKLLWKYGLSPVRVQRTTKDVVGRFLRMYDDIFPFQNLDQAVLDADLGAFTGVTGNEALLTAGVSDQFSREIVQASTRVNYAQNLDSIHGLETFVCMAIEGAMAVDGGNWQIFDQAVKRSTAKTFLNTTVAAVEKTDTGEYRIAANHTLAADLKFDTVVLAAPYQFANISFSPTTVALPKKIDYVSLHVTLFATPHRPSASFFGLDTADEVPDSILTTLSPNVDLADARGKRAVGRTGFWSLSTLRVIDLDDDEYPPTMSDEELVAASRQTHNYTNRQYLYKIFSPQPVSACQLIQLFALNDEAISSDCIDPASSFKPISQLSEKDITWHHIKVWNSYPYLPPRTTFDSFKLDDRFWYTSPMEAFISTMETSALSGRNVAKLIMNSLLQES